MATLDTEPKARGCTANNRGPVWTVRNATGTPCKACAYGKTGWKSVIKFGMKVLRSMDRLHTCKNHWNSVSFKNDKMFYQNCGFYANVILIYRVMYVLWMECSSCHRKILCRLRVPNPRHILRVWQKRSRRPHNYCFELTRLNGWSFKPNPIREGGRRWNLCPLTVTVVRTWGG